MNPVHSDEKTSVYSVCSVVKNPVFIQTTEHTEDTEKEMRQRD